VAPSARRRSPVPWLYGLSALLVVLAVPVFLGVWIADGTLEGVVPAVVAGIADLVAAAVAAVVATVLAARRGVRRVRTAVSGHPEGRAGRLAEHRAARWTVARERFRGLQREYAAFEADPRAVAARPALTDVAVPSTARFVEAYADADYLLTDLEPTGPRREEFAAAVDRAVAAWHDAVTVADALASPGASLGAAHDTRAVDPPRPPGAWAGTPGEPGGTGGTRRSERGGRAAFPR